MKKIKIRALKKSFLIPAIKHKKHLLKEKITSYKPSFTRTKEQQTIHRLLALCAAKTISKHHLHQGINANFIVHKHDINQKLKTIPQHLNLSFELKTHQAKNENIEFQYPILAANFPRHLERIYQAIKQNFPLLERKNILLSRYYPKFPFSHIKKLHLQKQKLSASFLFNEKPMQIGELVIFVDRIKRRSHQVIITTPNHT